MTHTPLIDRSSGQLAAMHRVMGMRWMMAFAMMVGCSVSVPPSPPGTDASDATSDASFDAASESSEDATTHNDATSASEGPDSVPTVSLDAFDGSDAPHDNDDAPDSEISDAESPDTLNPDSQAPDTANPDSQAPDTLNPDSQAPDTLSPDSQAPDALSSDTQASDTANPDATAGPPVGPAPTSFDHNLVDAGAISELLNLHQLAATTSVLIANRLFKLGDATCPGALQTTPQLVAADLAKPCTLTTSTAKLALSGRLAFAQPNLCKGSKLTTSTIVAQNFELVGHNNGAQVDIGLDLTYQSTPNLTAWTGRTRFTAVPSSWIPSTAKILTGADFTGWAVTTSGVAKTGRLFSGTYTLASKGTAKLTTEKPLITGATAQGCYKPTSGRLRFTGAVDAVVTFDGKGSCADPTWTRAGKAMGTVKLPFWSVFTLCGSG
ncbi:MAG: hypothetical protein KC502_18175 [Myxococcales bacterium]|nr:hypothetical protein [Myxococcales bacterium]